MYFGKLNFLILVLLVQFVLLQRVDPCNRPCGGGEQAVWIKKCKWYGSCHEVIDRMQPCNMHPCPIDCVLSVFAPWSECSKSCGGGQMYRLRYIQVHPQYGGRPCDSTIETAMCNQNSCPIDCVLSEFGPWSVCSKSCGGGQMYRVRGIQVPSQYGGRQCDITIETDMCNQQSCPIDCVLSEYGPWSECTKSCGGGQIFRLRFIQVHPQYGGRPCDATIETALCNQHKCPIDCVLSVFEPWSACSTSCGPGQKVRVRSIITFPLYGGLPCETTTETNICNLSPCPCVLSNWTEWSHCDRSCNGGSMSRTRSVIKEQDVGGECLETTEIKQCNDTPCPIDCEMNEWAEWTQCSTSCNQGTKTRTRTIKQESINGGKPCNYFTQESEPCNQNLEVYTDFSECSASCGGGKKTRYNIVPRPIECDIVEDVEPCNTQPCPVDCVGNFGEWSKCDKTCGGGKRQRIKEIIVMNNSYGKDCGPIIEEQLCNTCPCPVNCVMGNYSSWSECSHSCGGGTRSRTRDILTQPSNGGKKCGGTIDFEVCNTRNCPIDCVGIWTDWSECSKTCGGGTSKRTKVILVNPEYNGTSCGTINEEVVCNDCPCPVHCEMSSWSEWTGCSKTCGDAFYSRTRTIKKESAFGGDPCGETMEVMPCKLSECPKDCVVDSVWSSWGLCSKSCGTGFRVAYRSVLVPPDMGGNECEETKKIEECNTHPCPIDCVMSTWGGWSECDRSCGGGKSIRTRCVLTEPENNGKPCGPTLETKYCNTKECPIDCVVTIFSSWSKCPVTCGGGTQIRTRKINTPSRFGGQCPALNETRPCNTGVCPVDCVLDTWSSWGPCDITCGNGVMKRSRNILVNPNSNGKQCEPTEELMECNTQPCPIDCHLSEWSEWSVCTKTCGGGTKVRERHAQEPQHGGKPCDDYVVTETNECNTNLCPVDCVMCNWEDWSVCSRSCGSGNQTRTRCVHRFPMNGGKECGSSTMTRTCNTNPCPVDCSASKWSQWTTCDKTCGSGTRYRYRNFTEPQFNGKPCSGSTNESMVCNTTPCPVDCQMSMWTNFSSCSKPCSGGESFRTRTVVDAAKYGGKPCGLTHEVVRCNTEVCSVSPT